MQTATAPAADLDADASLPLPIPAENEAGHVGEKAGISYREILADLNYRRLWFSQLWSGVGDALAMVALPLLVYDLTGSERLVGVIAVAQTVPRVLLSPIAGVLLDRMMLAADAERALLVALIPFTAAVWQIGVIAALVGVGNAVGRPAEMAAVPAVAGKDRLVRALSLAQVTSAVVRVLVPAIGAGLIAAVGPKPVFWLQALAFVASFLCLLRLVLPPLERTAEEIAAVASGLAGAWADLRVGLGVMWRNKVVRGITAIESLWQVVGAALVIAGVAYMERSAGLGDRADAAYALLTTFMASGVVAGALVASRIERRLGRGWLMAVGYLGPLFLLPVFTVPPLPLVYALVFFFGLADAWAVIAFQTCLAEAVPDALRGRVFATWTAVITAASAGGFALVGWLTPILTPEWTLALSGILVGIGGPLILQVTGALTVMRRGTAANAAAA
jgi:MFS family permease